MSVPVHHPKIRVLLYKTIGRQNIAGQTAASQRFKGSNRIIDLTPFLGESGSVRTNKSVRDPAGGFSITLADKLSIAQEDSLYGLIEPMDIIEIRMARDPWKYANSGLRENLPIHMRGFVSDVRRTEVIGQDGHPARAVLLTGQDYGKIWQIMQIFYMPNYVFGQDLLSVLKLFINYGVGFEPDIPGGQFVKEVIDKVLNPYILLIAGQSGLGVDVSGAPVGFVQTIQSLDAFVTQGVISPFGANNFQGGTIYELLRKFCDVGPFNELFIEDREDNAGGVAVVYRPNPLRTVDGAWIQDPGAFPPEFILVTDADIVGVDEMRSDADVANYYWVDSPRYALQNSAVMKMAAAIGPEETFFLKTYQNSAPELYGLRKIETSIEQGPNTERTRGDGQKKGITDAEAANSVEWLEQRRLTLMAQNKDNVVFERGSIRLKGREDIKAGKYLNINRNGFKWECYAVNVSHDFMPFGNFTTTVSFERGTNFIQRVQREGGAQSPYLSELNARGVYNG